MGKRVIYNSIFIPEELIRASGAEPYPLYLHISDCHDSSKRDALRFMDPFNRNILGTVLEMDLSENDILVMAAYDSHSMRMIEMLKSHDLEVYTVNVPPLFYDKSSEMFYQHELELLKEHLTSRTGISIDELSLKRGRAETLNRLTNACSGIFFSASHDDAEIIAIARVITDAEKRYLNLAEQSGMRIADVVADDGDEALIRIIREYDCTESRKGDESQLFSRFNHGFGFRGILKDTEKRFSYIRKLAETTGTKALLWLQMSFDEVSDLEYELMSEMASGTGMKLLRIEYNYDDNEEELASAATRLESFAMML